jgi:hypothetical protein
MVINSTIINKMNNHLSSSLNTKDHDIWCGNPEPGLRQAQKSGEVKLVNVITTLPSWYKKM